MPISLKAARINAGLSQEELANKINVAVTSVSRWEQGLSKPRVDVAFELAHICGIKIDDITWGE